MGHSFIFKGRVQKWLHPWKLSKTNGWNLKMPPWEKENIYKPANFGGIQPFVFGDVQITVAVTLAVLALGEEPLAHAFGREEGEM